MKHRIISSVAAAACLLGTSWANAAIVFQDNFDAEALELNATLDNWDVTSGTVDVIGDDGDPDPDFFDFLPGNGRYLDMDGTSNAAGTILSKTTFSFFSGITYTLSFSLAGNYRSAGAANIPPGFDTLFATIGGNTLTANAWWQQPFATYTLTFTPVANFSSKLSFQAFGSDNQGPLLDNVVLSAVPVPAAAWLIGSALLGLVAVGRRRA